ncbi:hypothetical protein [Agrobacterium rosae]|uniref:hypothetical protein n=1 Tax=Agrobacterium rosae TaxID=1972867 RepID=UPI003A7FB84B
MRFVICVLSFSVLPILYSSLLFAEDLNPGIVSMQSGANLTVPDGKRWVIKKENIQGNSIKLYVKGVFYLSKDVVAQITPPTDFAPSSSTLMGSKMSDEVELDMPNGTDYDIYFLGGAQIRVESNNGPVKFLDIVPQ